MKSIKVCEYSRSRSFHDDLILQDQVSGERSQDQWSSGLLSKKKKCRHVSNMLPQLGKKNVDMFLLKDLFYIPPDVRMLMCSHNLY